MTDRVERVLTRAWMRRGLLAWMLWPLSLLFSVLVALRQLLYRRGTLTSSRLPVPVIVIGNIFIGGTGKTPFTIWLVQELRRMGYMPGVISRGYGGKNDKPVVVDPQMAATIVGDEPLLIARRAGCPVVVGRDRVRAAKHLLASYPQVDLILSDDGLQHYALQRDVEIVLYDERGNGNGWLLPAGPLREPAGRRRDFTVLNGESIPHGMSPDTVRMRLEGVSAFSLCEPSRVMPLSAFGARPVLAAAGIGNPSRFFSLLRDAGLEVQELPLPDHHDYATNPFAQVEADNILITEKDAVKCAQIDTMKNDPRLWVVPVTARIDRALAERIVEKCRGRPTA